MNKRMFFRLSLGLSLFFTICVLLTSCLGTQGLSKAKSIASNVLGAATGTASSPGNAGSGTVNTAAKKVMAKTMQNIVFSKQPIDPANPKNLTRSFKAGDYIYGLVQLKDTAFNHLSEGWKKSKKIENIDIQYLLDGEKYNYECSYYITLRNDAMNQDYLLLEIAPDPGKIKSFSNPNIKYKGSHVCEGGGPACPSKCLGELKSGTHTVGIKVYRYKDWGYGEFQISGSDFSSYAKLNETYLDASTTANRMGKQRMKNAKLERQMKKIMKSRGYNVMKVVIVEPDWWIERHKVSGAILWRNLGADISFKEGGKCFFRHVKFKCTYYGGKYKPMKFWSEYDKKKLPCSKAK